MRFRSNSFKKSLRTRRFFGVTSNNASSPIYSKASSKLILRGGVKPSETPSPFERILESFFSLQILLPNLLVLHFAPHLAPVQVAVFPLQKHQSEAAREIYKDLKRHFRAEFDESGAIGKRYRRQDEIGTPFCITVDFDTETDGAVTVRDRDSMQQERVAVADLAAWLNSKM